LKGKTQPTKPEQTIMTIQIWRTDLTDLTGKDVPQQMGGYDSISLWTILAFMENMATEEAARRADVDHVSKVTDKVDTQVISRFTLIGNGASLVEYTYQLVEDDDDTI
jgi:hypothetical protein